jgi:hypothetical protein
MHWRKGWDSNPRCPCRHAGFQDRCLKPLGHPSVFGDQRLSRGGARGKVPIAIASRRILVRCERTASRSRTAGHADLEATLAARVAPRFGELSIPRLTGPVVSILLSRAAMPVLPTDPRHDLCRRMTRSTCPACGPTPPHVGLFVPGSLTASLRRFSRSAARARRLSGASLPLSRTFYCAPATSH